MDIVIPLHEWSGTQNAELRYALRSFEKYIPHDRVVLIGFQPKWVQGVVHLPFHDDSQPAYREANIYLKLQHYIKSAHCTGDFIFTNDDHYILNEYDPAPPYPHKGTLLESFLKRSAGDPYRKTIDNTIKIGSNKYYNYDIHAPMLINPKIFTEVFNRKAINWGVKFGYLLKSLYGEGFEPGGQVLDLKFMEPASGDPKALLDELMAVEVPFFTTSDKAFNDVMIAALDMLYPDKSRYEK